MGPSIRTSNRTGRRFAGPAGSLHQARGMLRGPKHPKQLSASGGVARRHHQADAPPALVESRLQDEERTVGVCHNRSQVQTVGPCSQGVGAPAASHGQEERWAGLCGSGTEPARSRPWVHAAERLGVPAVAACVKGMPAGEQAGERFLAATAPAEQHCKGACFPTLQRAPKMQQASPPVDRHAGHRGVGSQRLAHRLEVQGGAKHTASLHVLQLLRSGRKLQHACPKNKCAQRRCGQQLWPGLPEPVHTASGSMQAVPDMLQPAMRAIPTLLQRGRRQLPAQPRVHPPILHTRPRPDLDQGRSQPERLTCCSVASGSCTNDHFSPRSASGSSSGAPRSRVNRLVAFSE